MGGFTELTTSSGHSFDAYVSDAGADAKGALVVIQEIFGVNSHIRSVCDRFAELGYTAIAPALFDRLKKNVEIDYDADGVALGLEYKNTLDDQQLLEEIAACRDHVAPAGKVSVVGYCWGGTLTYLTACHLPGFFKAIGYYGGGIPAQKDVQPQIPTLLHFGREDASIPMDAVEGFIAARPEVESHIYEAGHGFNCDVRASYDKEAADLALTRTLAFLEGS